MQLRRIEWFAVLAALAAGGAVPPGTLSSGDTGRLIVTFLGLASASILPTISLILASMTASGRSVKALNDLRDELTAAMDALFLLFGLVGFSFVLLLILTFPFPKPLTVVPHLSNALDRGTQALIVAACVLVILRAGQVPGILRRSMAIRHQIAVDEARRKTAEKAPEAGSVASAFANHPDFGKTIDLDELRQRGPH